MQGEPDRVAVVLTGNIHSRATVGIPGDSTYRPASYEAYTVVGSPLKREDILSVLCSVQGRRSLGLYVCGQLKRLRMHTRHYDGRVREKSLGNLLSSNPDWAPPFVLMLVGEYVDEIIKVILSGVDAMRNDRYMKFVADNPAFMRRLQKQVVSYWSYDSGYRRFNDYPGYQVLQQLGWWSGPEGRKLLKRDRRSKSQR